MKTKADTVIIGAGILGLSTAYNLTRRGVRDLVVIEQGYLAAGASGRNGGGIRQQWATEVNVRLMQQSVAICKRFAKELGVNVWFRQGGYLFLARSPLEQERLERNTALQNSCAVPTRMLSPAEALKIVPDLNLDGIVAAAYNPSDGVLFPWPFLWGYAQGAARHGAEIHTFTEVTGLEKKGGGYLVRTNRGDVECGRVIVAAGAWSPRILRFLGVELPNHPVKHEIMVTEPLKPFLRPMVSVLQSGLYFSQSMRGEVVGGITMRKEERSLDFSSTLEFLGEMAAAVCELMPRLGELKVLRQWAGPYDVTPDGNPLLGEPDGLPGLYLNCGFMGHGFMMAPIVGKLYAEWLTGGAQHELFKRCTLQRFKAGAIETEDMNIG
ncbi:MAG TPA: FAD-binding oxidoreductase [Polyangia bacterium]|jgi:sarcosine oxidase subunit beta